MSNRTQRPLPGGNANSEHKTAILLAIKTFIHVLFSNKFLSIRGNIFALIGYYFKINIFNILTGQKRDMTELKFVWLVNMTGNCPKIILSPDMYT